MRYTLEIETTPEETQELIGVLYTLAEGLRQMRQMRPKKPPAPPEASPPPVTPAPSEEVPEPPPEAPADRGFWDTPDDFFHVVETRQSDTPDAYGTPLEFKVTPARTPEEQERAHVAWSDFLLQWCSPFSSDDDSAQYPNRAKIIEDFAGTPLEGRIKQCLALHGSVNRAVYEWLGSHPWTAENFSAEDRESDLLDLADKISGSIAQLASVLMPELLVLYDISPNWRKHTNDGEPNV